MDHHSERSVPSHPQLDLMFEISEGIWKGAFAVARVTARHLRRKRRSVNATLRPGADTPGWNILAAAIRPYLRKRGEKVLLARWLGLDAARVSEYFGKNSAMPDAERTLMLIHWLAMRRAGRSPG